MIEILLTKLFKLTWQIFSMSKNKFAISLQDFDLLNLLVVPR